MEDCFGWKCGVDENGGKTFFCVFPPLMFMLGGAWVLYFGISSYYSDLEFGLFDEEYLAEQLTYDIIIGSIVAGIGLILLIVLLTIKFLYKCGYFKPYGFTYNTETKMISVHNGHRKREFYIGDLIRVKYNNNMLDQTSYNHGIYKYVKTSYGFMKLTFIVNGKRKTAKPFGLISSVEGTANHIYSLCYEELARKEKEKSEFEY